MIMKLISIPNIPNQFHRSLKQLSIPQIRFNSQTTEVHTTSIDEFEGWLVKYNIKQTYKTRKVQSILSQIDKQLTRQDRRIEKIRKNILHRTSYLRAIHTKLGWFMIPSLIFNYQTLSLIHELFDQREFSEDTPKEEIQSFLKSYYGSEKGQILKQSRKKFKSDSSLQIRVGRYLIHDGCKSRRFIFWNHYLFARLSEVSNNLTYTEKLRLISDEWISMFQQRRKVWFNYYYSTNETVLTTSSELNLAVQTSKFKLRPVPKTISNVKYRLVDNKIILENQVTLSHAWNFYRCLKQPQLQLVNRPVLPIPSSEFKELIDKLLREGWIGLSNKEKEGYRIYYEKLLLSSLKSEHPFTKKELNQFTILGHAWNTFDYFVIVRGIGINRRDKLWQIENEWRFMSCEKRQRYTQEFIRYLSEGKCVGRIKYKLRRFGVTFRSVFEYHQRSKQQTDEDEQDYQKWIREL